MPAPRQSFLVSLLIAVIALPIAALGKATLKAIFDVTVQDYWKDTAYKFIQSHLGSWSTDALEWIGPFWSGVGSTLLLALIIGLLIVWFRRRRRAQKASLQDSGEDPSHLEKISQTVSDGVRTIIDGNEGQARVDLIGKINDLVYSLRSDHIYDESAAISQVNAISKQCDGLVTDKSFKLTLVKFAEAVRHVKEARQCLRKHAFVALLPISGIANDVLACLEGWREALVYGLRGGSDPFTRGSQRTPPLPLSTVLGGHIDFKARLDAVEGGSDAAKPRP